jgi:hypothetical protein
MHRPDERDLLIKMNTRTDGKTGLGGFIFAQR